MATLNDMSYKMIANKRKDAYQGNGESPEQFAKGGMVSCKSCGGKMAEGGMSCAQGCKMSYGGKMAEGGPAGKKGAIMAIISKIGKKPMSSPGQSMEEMSSEGEGEESEMPVSQEAKMAAAKEVMSALKSNDIEMFAGALENFVRSCGGMED